MKIKRGDIVKDKYGNKGVVVNIDEWTCNGPISDENHGLIAVWQIDRSSYGIDNCEHYPLYNWNSCLKIVDNSIKEYN